MKRIRQRKKLNMKTKISIIIILIGALTYFFVHTYYRELNPKIVNVAKQEINKVYKYFLSSHLSYDIMAKTNFDDVLDIYKNQDGEILNVNINLEKTYQVLDIITKELTQNITDLEQGKSDLTSRNLSPGVKGLILTVPLFSASSNALLSHLGPKVYLQVNFIGSLLTNIKTKVTNYGLNNALIEIFITVEATHEIISPVQKEEQKISYDVLVASKIINGRVPAIYGDTLTKESNIYESELKTSS